jgi:phosphoserine phosphatase RsbU/P
MTAEPLTVALLRSQVANVVIGIVFLFVGLTALGMAVIRRRREFRVLVWFGLFIGMYGARLLAQVADALGFVSKSSPLDHLITIVDYLLVVPGLLFWVELSLGKLRRFLQVLTVLGAGTGILGLCLFYTSGPSYRLLRNNVFIAISMLLVVAVVVAVPALSRKYLVIQSRVLVFAVPAIAVVALYVNLSGILGYRADFWIEPPAFVFWVFALGYVAAQRVFSNERRLFSIESELETARQIQFSILPSSAPKVKNVRIAASYDPMSAVAGDFYQFIQVDPYRVGVLLADVSGHGVPAALISSMIKVATQSVAVFANDPAQVLRGLNRILSTELKGQLTSAAYLWIDTENHTARYSAAGHPPLLCWRDGRGELERIESNGLLFGIADDCDYPVRNLTVESGDRFLIYTDGLVEPENARGESFGDRQLEQVVRKNLALPAPEMLQQLLSELQKWRPASMSQQDDITLIVVDVV